MTTRHSFLRSAAAGGSLAALGDVRPLYARSVHLWSEPWIEPIQALEAFRAGGGLR